MNKNIFYSFRYFLIILASTLSASFLGAMEEEIAFQGSQRTSPEFLRKVTLQDLGKLKISHNQLVRSVVKFIVELQSNSKHSKSSLLQFKSYLKARNSQDNRAQELIFLNSKSHKEKILTSKKRSNNATLKYGYAKFIETLLASECALRSSIFMSKWDESVRETKTFPKPWILGGAWFFKKKDPDSFHKIILEKFSPNDLGSIKLQLSKEISKIFSEQIDRLVLRTLSTNPKISSSNSRPWIYNFKLRPSYATDSIIFTKVISEKEIIFIDRKGRAEIIDFSGETLAKIGLGQYHYGQFKSMYTFFDSKNNRLLVSKYDDHLVVINPSQKDFINIDVNFPFKDWRLRQGQDNTKLIMEFKSQEKTQYKEFKVEWDGKQFGRSIDLEALDLYSEKPDSLIVINPKNSYMLAREENIRFDLSLYNLEKVPLDAVYREPEAPKRISNEYDDFDRFKNFNCMAQYKHIRILGHDGVLSFWTHTPSVTCLGCNCQICQTDKEFFRSYFTWKNFQN